MNITKLSFSWSILASTCPVMGELGQVLVVATLLSAVMALVAVFLLVAVVPEASSVSGVLKSQIAENQIHETKNTN